MSNVFIAATGELGLSVAVHLGPNERKVHAVPAGEDIELTVGGNQTLKISAVDDGPTAEAEAPAIPVGADVTEGDPLIPGVDVFPEDGQPVPPVVEGEDSPDDPLLGEGSPLDIGDPLKNPFDENLAE